jgi:hypothetical protein
MLALSTMTGSVRPATTGLDVLVTVAIVGSVLLLIAWRLHDAWHQEQTAKQHDAEARRRAYLTPLSPRARQLQSMTAVLAAVGIVAAMIVLQVRPMTGMLIALSVAGGWRAWQAKTAPTHDVHAAPVLVTCGASDPNVHADRKIRIARDLVKPSPGFDGCGHVMRLDTAFRCVECGRFFHRTCAAQHFVSHGAPARSA